MYGWVVYVKTMWHIGMFINHGARLQLQGINPFHILTFDATVFLQSFFYMSKLHE